MPIPMAIARKIHSVRNLSVKLNCFRCAGLQLLLLMVYNCEESGLSIM